MKNLHPRTKLDRFLATACLALAPSHSPSIRHRTEAIPTGTPLKVKMRSSASEPASTTRHWLSCSLKQQTGN